MVTTVYVAAALAAAPAIYVAAEVLGHGTPRPPHRFAYSLLAALLWPLLAVGLVEFAMIAALGHRARVPVGEYVEDRADAPAAPSLVGVP